MTQPLTVYIRRDLLRSPIPFISEVRRQMRMAGVCREELSRMEYAALDPNCSPILIVLQFVDIKIAP